MKLFHKKYLLLKSSLQWNFSKICDYQFFILFCKILQLVFQPIVPDWLMAPTEYVKILDILRKPTGNKS